jgi:hypothetical protein
MTLILTINGPETIWMLADRRLSVKGRPVKDDARKMMFLETTDGVAILGYAGLGATSLGNEPADWMSAVLRTRNLPLEQCLGTIADAMKREFPRHMARIPGTPAHNVIVPAFVGEELKLYTIDLAFAPDRRSYQFRYTRHVVGDVVSARSRTPRLALSGSGAAYLVRENKRWLRGLLRVVRAHDRGQMPPVTVGDHLANLNSETHQHDNSVGPRCVVAWRHRKGGAHRGGGGHQFYTGTTRDASSPSLPTIGTGIDIRALASAMVPIFTKMFDATRSGQPPKMSEDEINTALARLPDKPDEKLR